MQRVKLKRCESRCKMSNKTRLLGNLSKGLIFVISAPAGAGKTTLVERLAKEFDSIQISISYTTRAPRLQEKEGIHYYYISEKEFKQKIDQGEFLEHVSLFGNQYGTSKKMVEQLTQNGKHVILVIDTQGAMKLKNEIAATYIFIMPPSLDELAKRLEIRGTDTKESRQHRLRTAEKEIEAAKHYDYVVINDDLHTAYQALRSIVIAEEHRSRYLLHL
jgi:guanylate kinase